MKYLPLLAALALCSCVHPKPKPQPRPDPNLGGTIGKSESVQKLNKKALDGAEELRRIELRSRPLLDQLDYKATKLLEK